jgi:membrane fusion protein (multidrug efflux system)
MCTLRYKLLLFFLLLLPTLFLMPGCGGSGSEGSGKSGGRGQGAITVRVDTARVSQLSFYDKFPAVVTALDEVELRPQVGGYITERHFRGGDYVRRGQKLFTIDVRRYVADVNRAAADVEAARANLKLSEKNVARYRRLAAEEAIAIQTLDVAEAEVEARRQAVAAAEATRNAAAARLDYAYIRAPLSGTTGLNVAKVGTQVSPGTPLLTVISKRDPIGVDFALPQADIPRLARLKEDGNSPDSTFRLRLPDGSKYSSYGEIYADGRAVNQQTGALEVRLFFANGQEILRPGMSLELEILSQQAGEQLTIPRSALGEQLGEYFVFLLRDSLVHRQKVTTGSQIRGQIIISEGLEPGDVIVTDGMKSLRDSSRVKVAGRK